MSISISLHNKKWVFFLKIGNSAQGVTRVIRNTVVTLLLKSRLGERYPTPFISNFHRELGKSIGTLSPTWCGPLGFSSTFKTERLNDYLRSLRAFWEVCPVLFYVFMYNDQQVKCPKYEMIIFSRVYLEHQIVERRKGSPLTSTCRECLTMTEQLSLKWRWGTDKKGGPDGDKDTGAGGGVPLQ